MTQPSPRVFCSPRGVASSLALATALALGTGDALALGLVVGGGEAELKGAQVLMTWGEDDVLLQGDLLVGHVSGEALWLLPIPEGATMEFEASSPLEALSTWGEPDLEVLDRADEGAGCGESAPGVIARTHGVFFRPKSQGSWIESGLLPSPSLGVVETFLVEAGFEVPGDLADTLGPALLLDNDVVWARMDAGDDIRLLPGLRVTFRRPSNGKQPLMLDGSEETPYELLLHVLADKRYRVENAPSLDVEDLGDALLALGEDDRSWESVLDSVAASAGGQVVVTEAALLLEETELSELGLEPPGPRETFLTRLRLRSHLEESGEVVVAFAKDGPEVMPVVKVFGSADPAWLSVWLLVFAGALWRRGRTAEPGLPG